MWVLLSFFQTSIRNYANKDLICIYCCAVMEPAIVCCISCIRLEVRINKMHEVHYAGNKHMLSSLCASMTVLLNNPSRY